MNVSAQSKLRLDAILPEEISAGDPSSDNSHFYTSPPAWKLKANITGAGKICPSNYCKMVDDESTNGLSLATQPTSMRFWGDFRLMDNVSNSKLTPMKKALVENIVIESSCDIIDIQEDQNSNTTKYICGKSTDYIPLIRKLNDTNYTFRNMSLIFELPSRHLVVEAIEE
jgi:hypothetical protein